MGVSHKKITVNCKIKFDSGLTDNWYVNYESQLLADNKAKGNNIGKYRAKRLNSILQALWGKRSIVSSFTKII